MGIIVIFKLTLNASSDFVMPELAFEFNFELALRYLPIKYSHQCDSGPPVGIYYRIINQTLLKGINKCIQYFFYWKRQKCIFSSHNFDYEPIFIYLNFSDDLHFVRDPSPYMIVNGGFADP